jgi:hypothetical protein
MASQSSFSKVQKRFVDREWIKIQSDLEINVPSAVTGQQQDVPGDLERQIEAFIEHYNHRRTLHSPGHG